MVPEELALFENLLVFAESILKTNFFASTKTALSFRLNPSFLRKEEFPEPLFGMFMVVGSEFRGFHLRFQDIARGGIRVIQSRNAQVYDNNLRSLFDENYNLALTQQRKNKDLVEGGAKVKKSFVFALFGLFGFFLFGLYLVSFFFLF